MSYQVLARKWRPRNFKEMAGQTHVLRTLINALDNERLHHAYLFTGTRGVGKTTIARILARCLNCETGITSTPCGECSACREISEGRFLDLIEVDAASRTKVEDTRELLENVQYAPSRGRFKVYLIDEVHMLSAHSFNALLKTLEEPPPHVKFLLATTDPQKLPVTVLSRCLQFNLKNLSPERLVEHIRHILEQENIAFEEAALWQLGRAAQGSVRDCLTLLDQAIGFCDGTVTDSGVREFLGNIDRSVIVALMDALVAQDAAGVLQQVNIVAEHAPDFAMILQELLSWLHRIAIAQVVPDGIDNSQGDRDQVLAHAASLPAETVQLYYQIALKGREDMPFAPDARSGFEMILLRMLAFTPAGMAVVAQAPATQLHDTTTSEAASASGIAAGAGQKKKPVADPAPRAVAARERKNVMDALPPAPPGGVMPAQDAPGLAGATSPSASEDALVNAVAPTGSAAGALASLEPAHWSDLFDQLPLSGVTRSIAANCVLQAVQDAHLTLLLEEAHATLFSDEHRKRIELALTNWFGEPVALTMDTGKVTGETPAAHRKRVEAERQAEAVRAFTEDALVQAIVERFGADIQYESITPMMPHKEQADPDYIAR